DRQHLRREDPAHLGRGSGGCEDEPRQRDERHRGPGQRDELRSDQADERTVPQHANKIKRTYGFVKWLGFPPMPKVTQEHLDARSKWILDRPRRAFAEHGYEGASVARLEEATGLSRGAIFHYFENKNDLFVELAMEMNTRFGAIFLDRGLYAP